MDAMFFNSQAYLIFLSLVLILYWSVPFHRLRIWILLAASYCFYAFWSQQLALLVASTTVMDYLLARGMDSTSSTRIRKVLLATSLSINLGLLCYFKYANFFIDSLRHALSSIGVTSTIPYLELIIPFGISFYTFEAISYTIDVYRRKISAEQNLSHFMLFILFFPHLVAGPIVRARDFLPQAERRKRFSWLRMQLGVQFFLMGFIKKVIADRMAEFSDPIFNNPEAFKTSAVWVGVIAFAIRIYCDFSGYSDMAIGSAHMLGYKLTINFRMPYLSLNVSEFWRRWHISLSTWLRDYVFIPLGGSRASNWATTRNLMITMLLGGLWHGANWSYVLWGSIHGTLLVLHRGFRNWCESHSLVKMILQTWIGIVCRWALTSFCVLLTWIFFQPSLGSALTMFEKMFSWHSGDIITIPNQSLWILLGFLAFCHFLGMSGWWARYSRMVPASVMGLGYAIVISVGLLLTPDHGKTFIYFQF
jgi:alginate O-acetyltransferase complex protein AlgI